MSDGQYVSLCDGYICDGIIFDIWYVFTTFGMFLSVILGYATTFWCEMGVFLGLGDTLEILECFQQTDTAEPYTEAKYIALQQIIRSAAEQHC